MGKLDGKVAIVTGAARGIGRAYALHLASLGAKVAVTDINLKSYADFKAEADVMTGESTVHEIADRGGQSLGFEFDVSDRDAVFAMARQVAKVWGRIDILVANVGGNLGKLAETTATLVQPELLERVTRINFHGTVHCCSAVAPFMKEQRSGKIVTVASHAGSVAQQIGGAHYGASKAAVAHYTRYLAQEMGPYGVHANCIAPGIIATGRIEESFLGARSGAKTYDEDALRKLGTGEIALRRLGTVADCVGVIEFLTTDLSSYVTGALIPIDGGWNRAG
jgi:3-oxoacyl-[acyl-carrier protein] reductase